jgi:hypothetical protein
MPKAAAYVAPDDYAIVAGISHYPDPELGKLDGPENDARAFYDWVTTKGGVAKTRAHLILSSNYRPPAKRPIGAKPDENEIVNIFRGLNADSVAKVAKRKGPRLGRRLYIFLAGHGFVPKWSEKIFALLTANADKYSPSHVPAPLYQRWARETGVFDEVLLFMDCCGASTREYDLMPAFVISKNPQAAASGRIFFAAACKPGFVTRERARKVEGKSRGVFTLCLLDGLDALAAKNGQITNHSLAQYLEEQLKTYVNPEDLDDDEVSKTPHVDFDPKGTPFVLFDKIAKPQTLHEVTLRFRKADVGKKYTLCLGLHPQHSAKVRELTVTLELPTGIYLVQIAGRERSFELPLAKGVARVDI